MPRPKYTPEERLAKFWERVDKSGGEDTCWLWTAYCYPLGYGLFWSGVKNELAHRLAFRLTNGEFPDELFVLHSCDNPPCVNPKHLFLGTDQDNKDDMMRKGRNNQPFGEKHWACKLSDMQVVEVRERYARGEADQATLASEFHVHQSTISLAIHHKLHRRLKNEP